MKLLSFNSLEESKVQYIKIRTIWRLASQRYVETVQMSCNKNGIIIYFCMWLCIVLLDVDRVISYSSWPLLFNCRNHFFDDQLHILLSIDFICFVISIPHGRFLEDRIIGSLRTMDQSPMSPSNIILWCGS